jgi:hypothetical protein
MGVGCHRHAPTALPPEKTRYPLHKRLRRPQGRSEQVRKRSPQMGFDPPTVQPVASLYADCVIPAHDTERVPGIMTLKICLIC